ncbi:MAG: NYN domain-containing protein [Cyanobacteriota bacterium]|nr:NYN domain-containing protein [Cyanobacteriota bacterium]
MNAFSSNSSLAYNVRLYWDFQNVGLPQKKNFEKYIKLVLSFAQSKGKLQSAKVYAYWRKEQEAIEKEFNEVDFDCITLPDDVENNVDRKIIQNCQRQILQERKKSLIILITGDSDFLPLVSELKDRGHRVIVIGRKQTSKKLKQEADEFCYLSDLEAHISEIEFQPNLDKLNILYSDAVECLVKATEFVFNQGKSPCLSRIDRQMRQINKLYRGASSICSREGKKFKCFKNFVEAAVKDGKIRMTNDGQNRELTLIRR